MKPTPMGALELDACENRRDLGMPFALVLGAACRALLPIEGRRSLWHLAGGRHVPHRLGLTAMGRPAVARGYRNRKQELHFRHLVPTSHKVLDSSPARGVQP